MFVKRIKRPNTPEYIYRGLQSFWRMHISVSDPDWEQLRDIHHALCAQEAQLRHSLAAECLENLNERLAGARQFGMELPMPQWAGEELAALGLCADGKTQEMS